MYYLNGHEPIINHHSARSLIRWRWFLFWRPGHRRQRTWPDFADMPHYLSDRRIPHETLTELPSISETGIGNRFEISGWLSTHRESVSDFQDFQNNFLPQPGYVGFISGIDSPFSRPSPPPPAPWH